MLKTEITEVCFRVLEVLESLEGYLQLDAVRVAFHSVKFLPMIDISNVCKS